ncbi:MAG: OB-fold domain-containing protein [Deltaproteobacteria bacterium]|nr:OB-fold domain-containing protein [Deltaproteobacteria bacterium]
MAGAPPLPRPDPLTRPFWEACRRRELVVSRCEACGHAFLPPGPCCPRCWSRRLAWRRASGRGRVWSFAVYRRTYDPALPAPYVVALVELEEGARLVSNLVGCAPEAARVDLPVRVRFDEVGELVLPRFEPAPGEGERP